MLKYLTRLVFIWVAFGFLRWITQTQTIDPKKSTHFDTAGHGEDIEHRNSNFESRKFYEGDKIHKSDSVKYENLLKTIDNYVQRYVNLFLITSNLRDYKVKDAGEAIIIDLEISITGEDLKYLQDYSNHTSHYPKDFSRLDDIFYKIAKLKERTYLENAMLQSYSLFDSFKIFTRFDSHAYSELFLFIVLFSVALVIHHYVFHRTFLKFLFVIGNSFILWEALHLYWKKLKETDIEIYVKSLELGNALEKCDPAKVHWYENVINYFKGNPCLEYYKNLNKKAEEEVFLFNCIIETYGFYLFQMPCKILGASIKDFTGEVSNLWPWPFNYVAQIPLTICFLVIILFFIFVAYMKRIKVSFLGAAVEVGGGHPIENGSQRPEITSPQVPKAIRSIRKLRPWTKGRFSKRTELDLGTLRKFLKSSKSLSDIPDENKPDCSGTNKDLEVALKND